MQNSTVEVQTSDPWFLEQWDADFSGFPRPSPKKPACTTTAAKFSRRILKKCRARQRMFLLFTGLQTIPETCEDDDDDEEGVNENTPPIVFPPPITFPPRQEN